MRVKWWWAYTIIYFTDATLVKVFAEVFSGGRKKD
jgi:hypothetical protein